MQTVLRRRLVVHRWVTERLQGRSVEVTGWCRGKGERDPIGHDRLWLDTANRGQLDLETRSYQRRVRTAIVQLKIAG